jgi:signal transduction histidine kinase
VVLVLSFLLVAVVAAGVLLTWLGEKNMNYVDGGMFAFAGMIAMIISITKTPRSFVFALVGIVLLATGIMRMINPSFMQKEKLNTNIGTTALVGTLSIGLLTTALGGIVAERQRVRAAEQARDEAEQRLVRAAEQAREEEEQRLARAAQQAREEAEADRGGG